MPVTFRGETGTRIEGLAACPGAKFRPQTVRISFNQSIDLVLFFLPDFMITVARVAFSTQTITVVHTEIEVIRKRKKVLKGENLIAVQPLALRSGERNRKGL